jgi:thiamine-monophosphate kinase
LVEGVHFRRATTSPQDLGYKAVAVNASDVAAMGGRPLAFTVYLAAPGELDVVWLEALYDGLEQGACACACPLAGGDTSSAPQVFLSVAMLGTAPPPGPILRSGARPGDDLFVTGSPGESALGLRLLESGLPIDTPERQWLVSRHRRPTPRLEFGAALGEEGLASALIDVSDGLLQDLGHITRASGAGAEVWVERLPVSVPVAGVARELGLDPTATALGGGEDYELLLAAPAANRSRLFSAGRRTGTPVRRIGRITEAPGLRLLLQGAPTPVPDLLGFDHFSVRG